VEGANCIARADYAGDGNHDPSSGSAALVMTPRPITVTAQPNTKVFDGNTSAAAVPTITSGMLAPGDVATFAETYDTAAVGTGKTLTPAGTIDNGAGVNVTGSYSITFVPSNTGEITAASGSTFGQGRFWIGLKNSDATGLRVDLRAEVLVNGTVVKTSDLPNIPTGGSGFNNALLQTLTFAAGSVTVPSGAQLGLRVSVRRTCTGGGHNSGVVRLWFNGQPIDTGSNRDAGSRFTATTASVDTVYLLRTGGALSTTAGSAKQFVDAAVNSNVACPARPFVSFGTWNIAMP
jgi:hypothetical protein